MAGCVAIQTQEIVSLHQGEQHRADSGQVTEMRVKKLLRALVNMIKTFTERQLRITENRKETENISRDSPWRRY